MWPQVSRTGFLRPVIYGSYLMSFSNQAEFTQIPSASCWRDCAGKGLVTGWGQATVLSELFWLGTRGEAGKQQPLCHVDEVSPSGTPGPTQAAKKPPIIDLLKLKTMSSAASSAQDEKCHRATAFSSLLWNNILGVGRWLFSGWVCSISHVSIESEQKWPDPQSPGPRGCQKHPKISPVATHYLLCPCFWPLHFCF